MQINDDILIEYFNEYGLVTTVVSAIITIIVTIIVGLTIGISSILIFALGLFVTIGLGAITGTVKSIR